MRLHLSAPEFDLWHGDCIEVMRGLPAASVDAVVTDTPYELGFMGKGWDNSGIAYNLDVWREALRVLKPGGHLLAFGGTRTWHRLACAIEDAGFNMRDSIAWMYGSGFPKSLDVSKAIDKLLTRELTRELEFTAWMRTTGITSKQIDDATGTFMGGHYLTAKSQPAIPTAELMDRIRPLLPEVPQWIEDEIAEREARKAESRERNFGAEFLDSLELGNDPHEVTMPEAEQWQGWGTALKPAFEPIVVARKPLIGTVAENVLTHGTGALNIDGCRIGTGDELRRAVGGWQSEYVGGEQKPINTFDLHPNGIAGRWPANVILDESQAAALDAQSGDAGGGYGVRGKGGSTYANGKGFANTLAETGQVVGYGDTGGASRFFYTAKANSTERPNVEGTGHPTVKPLELMRYLVRLVTPPGGTVLEPFGGSGTTIEACVIEGFRCIAIELTEEYLTLIAQRLTKPIQVALL